MSSHAQNGISLLDMLLDKSSLKSIEKYDILSLYFCIRSQSVISLYLHESINFQLCSFVELYNNKYDLLGQQYVLRSNHLVSEVILSCSKIDFICGLRGDKMSQTHIWTHRQRNHLHPFFGQSNVYFSLTQDFLF